VLDMLPAAASEMRDQGGAGVKVWHIGPCRSQKRTQDAWLGDMEAFSEEVGEPLSSAWKVSDSCQVLEWP
jgi:hypothetical protein